MLKENKREEITKNIEKGEALVEQVADGIWRIGVELPQNPLRELNSYLIKGKENERDLLIDTGFRREECREALFAGLRALGSSPDRLDILLTHLHSDHTGLAREAAGADSRIYISGTDLAILKDGFTGASASPGGAIPCRGISGGRDEENAGAQSGSPL